MNTMGRTRFNIDFRTAHIDGLAPTVGAPNVDSAPRGSTLSQLLLGADLSGMPEEVLALYEDEESTRASLVFDEELQIWYRKEVAHNA